jgi:cold shock protein
MGSLNGTIKRLVSDKGFGFVAAPDGNEYFFHQSACTGVSFDELREGESVTFQTGQRPRLALTRLTSSACFREKAGRCCVRQAVRGASRQTREFW